MLATPGEDVAFSDSFDYPDGTSVLGAWDLRGRFREYVADLRLSNKTVLDLNPQSGFLSFGAEREGACVTAVQGCGSGWITGLHASSRLDGHRRPALCRQQLAAALDRSFASNHHALRSNVTLRCGGIAALDAEQRFDVVCLPRALSASTSPLDLLMAAAESAASYLLIVDAVHHCDYPAIVLRDSQHAYSDVDFVIWDVSHDWIVAVVDALGFTLHARRQASYDLPSIGRCAMWTTMVFRRASRPATRPPLSRSCLQS